MPLPHVCECHSVEPPQLGPGLQLAVRPSSARVARQFGLLLQAHDLPFEVQGPVMTVGTEHLARIQTVLTAMTEMDKQGLLAIPVTAEGPLDLHL